MFKAHFINKDTYKFQLALIVWIGVFLDSLNYFQNYFSGLSEDSNYSIWYRGGLFLMGSFCLIREKKHLFGSILFAIVVFSGTFLYSVNYPVNWFLTIKFVLKFLYPFVLYCLIKDIKGYILNWEQLFSNLLEFVILFHSITVIFGAIFNVDFLRSYSASRFGHTPLIASINEVSFFFLLAITYSVFKIQNEGGSKNILLGIIVFLASLLVGTKSIYLGLFLFLIYISIFLFPLRKKLFFVILLSLLLLFTVFFIFVWPFFYQIIDKYGVLQALSSMRVSLLKTKFLPLIIERWDWYNFFLGGGNTWEHFVEMDLIDLFSLSGLFGVLIILYLYFNSFFLINEYNKGYKVFFAIVFFSLGSMSGHFMWSGVNALFFVMICLLLDSKIAFNPHCSYPLLSV